jgi:GNAT superfamily N-acetyltransferase
VRGESYAVILRRMTEHHPRVLYAREQDLGAEEFRRVLVDSGLGAWRPVDDRPRLEEMLRGANMIVTARLEDPARTLVGVARTVTDFSWCAYLSDLAVSKSAQGLGVGNGLIDETRRQLGPRVSLYLFSVPDAAAFYERIGMARFADAFWFKRER